MEAFEKIKELIETQISFVLEAGAGSGKTYTLIQTINYLLDTRSEILKKKNQHIVCITYTNVAKNEVLERLGNNPLVLVSTIHEFLWDCIKRYNKQLIVELDILNETLRNIELNKEKGKPEKFVPGLKDRINQVTYDDSGYRDFEKGKLHHDDVISLSLQMFRNYSSLTAILGQKYPYILIDEYQDTAEETVSATIDYLLERNQENVLLGFYGDSYQKIYDEGVGSLQNYIDSKKLELVTKGENYRSSVSVINLLNNIRDNITQIIPETKERIEGSVKFINCRYSPIVKNEKKTDYEKRILPSKHSIYHAVITELEKEGWNLSETGEDKVLKKNKDSSEIAEDKILIIVNSKVAEQAGFGLLYKLYTKRFGQGAKEALMKRENPFSSFFMGSLDKKTSKERETGIEHLMLFWNNKEYNNVIRFLKRNGHFTLKEHPDKTNVTKVLDELKEMRESGTIEDVLNFCLSKQLSTPSISLSTFLKRINQDIDEIDDEEIKSKVQKDKDFYEALIRIPYKEVISAFNHIQDQTAFSTKHGTKGEEYRNVLVVIDDTSWKQKYNFQKFFNGTEDKPDKELRTKNLFYVSCSRAIENLVVLSLTEMDHKAMEVIENWFGKENIEIR